MTLQRPIAIVCFALVAASCDRLDRRAYLAKYSDYVELVCACKREGASANVCVASADEKWKQWSSEIERDNTNRLVSTDPEAVKQAEELTQRYVACAPR